MDGELLRQLYHELFHHNKLNTDRRCTYSDTIILFVHFLAVIHDRSDHWVHDRRNWPLGARRLRTPSYTRSMRRLGTTAVRIHIEKLNQTFRARLPRSTEKAVDGKPLVVGAYSRDADAKRECLAHNTWGEGYKLHAVVDANGAVEALRLTALNGGESTVARGLVGQLDLRGTVLRGMPATTPRPSMPPSPTTEDDSSRHDAHPVGAWSIATIIPIACKPSLHSNTLLHTCCITDAIDSAPSKPSRI